MQTGDIPDAMAAEVTAARDRLIESVAASDDDLMAKFFDDGTLNDEELVSGLRKAVAKRDIFPVLCGSAAQNKCDADAARQHRGAFAGGCDRPSAHRQLEGQLRGAALAQVERAAVGLRLQDGSFEVGKMAMVRVISGKLTSDAPFITPRLKSERIGQLSFHPGKRVASPGQSSDIIGSQLKALTGDTLCAMKDRSSSCQTADPAPVVRALSQRPRPMRPKLARLHDIAEEDIALSIERSGDQGSAARRLRSGAHRATLEKLRPRRHRGRAPAAHPLP